MGGRDSSGVRGDGGGQGSDQVGVEEISWRMANWGIADVERTIKEAIEFARAWTVRNAEGPAQKKKGF